MFEVLIQMKSGAQSKILLLKLDVMFFASKKPKGKLLTYNSSENSVPLVLIPLNSCLPLEHQGGSSLDGKAPSSVAS